MAVKQVFNTSAELDFPNVLPTLDLDFANSKTLDPRITFTRASGGSYVGADGLIKYAGVNEARFDHDPVTGESLGLLVEESRTNLSTWSEDVSLWDINTSAQVIVNQATAPNGTLTADEVECIESGNFSGRVTTIGSQISVNSTGSFSVFVKYINNPWVSISVNMLDAAVRRCWYNIQTGEVGGTSVASGGGGTLVSQAIQDFGNGWYRCSAVVTPPSGNNIRHAFIQPASGDQTVAAPRGSKHYIWGAQLEVGTFPTSYIPTQASTRTRAADIASITGKNFSEWYRQDEGTIYVEATVPEPLNKVRRIVFATDESLQNRIGVLIASINSPEFLVSTDGTLFVALRTGTSVTDLVRYASSYKLNDFRFSTNGLTAIVDTSGKVPSKINQLSIGSQKGIDRISGTISRLTYFPKALSPSNLQSLTS
jgi:hypothetical protein